MKAVQQTPGLIRLATIRRYNNDGTVLIRIDERGAAQTTQEYKVPLPLAWSGPDGEFIGGYPPVGSSVTIKQAQGGQWFIENYIPSRAAFLEATKMGVLQPGRAVMQVKGGTHIMADPNAGIVAGNSSQRLQVDPIRGIISHNFADELKFTQAVRSIEGIIKRELKENNSRGLLGSTLTSHNYNDVLTPIGMDPSSAPAVISRGGAVRNAALAEARKIYYEFADGFDFGTDEEESQKISDPNAIPNKLNNGRKEIRADTASISLQFPNHLIETTVGTFVDSLGNILDINRNPLPIGKIDELSLRKNPDKTDSFARIRAMLRKSIAFHWELNARKAGEFDEDSGAEGVSRVPDVDDFSNYARSRSKFSFDLDKEGTFKWNVPASSETGNVPLLVRHENYSNLMAKKDSSIDPNSFIKNKDRQDIYLDSYAGKPGIKLKGSDSLLDGYESPINRINDEPILYGTAFHDILASCKAFLPDAPKMVLYEPNPLIETFEPYEKLVEDILIVSGKDANAGGRSGSIALDGFLAMSVGANTSDRQSMWLDTAGGIVSMIGRDKRGISHAMHLDGDMVIQIGGAGIGNSYDSRFSDLNDGARVGALDIRIMDGDRAMTIFRLDKNGVRVATEGVFQVQANQGIALNTHGGLVLNGERVAFFTNTGLTRVVQRNGINI